MSPEDLVKALAYLPKRRDPRLIVGPDTLDDAGVVVLTPDVALVQTVDFFPPIVDDPTWYGRIGAANALSDVYAMGGVPHSCLSIVGWPKDLDPSLLGQILKGGQEKIDESGAILAGGHTITDTDIKYGLAVTGTIHPSRILSNAGARAGDVLVLTKPLGMGALSTGIKKQKVPADLAERAMAQMATLNKAGCEAALAHGSRAATDVTGFGFCGHLFGMAQASKVSVEIEAKAVPAFEGALDLIGKGVLSGGAKRNRSYLGDNLTVGGGVDEARVQLLLDAETSGGLLITVAEGAVDALVRDLTQRRTPCAAVVGRVVPRQGAAIALR